MPSPLVLWPSGLGIYIRQIPRGHGITINYKSFPIEYSLFIVTVHNDTNNTFSTIIKGVEVLHLFQGRPLCSLPLAPMHTSHADIDADGTIEHMSAILTHPEGMCVIMCAIVVFVPLIRCLCSNNGNRTSIHCSVSSAVTIL